MSAPNLLPGRMFRLNRGNGAAPEVFAFVCTATTTKLDEELEVDDAMMPDCANPTDVSRRQTVPKGQTWDVTASGKCDHARYLVFRGDFDAKLVKNYQLLVDDTGANGGGGYKGAALCTKLSLSKSENGIVTFDFTLKGQGVLTFTAAA